MNGEGYYGGENTYDDTVMPSWERRRAIGFIPALFRSIPEILLRPQKTFRQMPAEGGIAQPLIFLLIVGSIGYIADTAWQFVTYSSVNTLAFIEFLDLPRRVQRDFEQGAELWRTLARSQTIILGILAPLVVAITAFIHAGILHGCLMLVRGAERGFETTLRVICYSSGATALLAIVPLCGAIVGFLWYLICLVIGFREAHQITTGTALAAVLLPLAVCCCCLVMFFGGLTALFVFAVIMEN